MNGKGIENLVVQENGTATLEKCYLAETVLGLNDNKATIRGMQAIA